MWRLCNSNCSFVSTGGWRVVMMGVCWSGGGIRDWLRCGIRGEGFGGEWWC